LELEPRRVDVGEASIFHYDVGEGPAVVLLHGFNDHAEAFTRNIIPIAAAGHRVVALDLPGFGRSGLPNMRYSLLGFAQALLDFMEALGIERAHLVGSSMGGAIALRTALQQPDRVQSVVAVNTAGMFARPPWAWRLGVNPVAKALFRPLVRPLIGRADVIARSHRRAYYDHTLPVEHHTEVAAAAFAQAGYKDHFLRMIETLWATPEKETLWEGLPRLTTPVLVIWGRQDRTLPLRHGYRAIHRIPHAEFIVYDRCGHLPMFERAEDFNRDVVAFLAKHGYS
jgi:4,5:9,10-diseco-3-hydroxy-5,9,17-trioxoandrosta-1(10),2-diene-4-oate hydrolase